MKVFIKAFLVLAFLGLLLPVFVFAQGLGIPHQFYGQVTFTNGVTLDGLLVKAKINNSTVGSSVTADGKYGYTDLLLVTDTQSTNAGKIIEFYVSGIKANETAIFVNGVSTNLNLTVTETLEENGDSEEEDEGDGGGGSSGGGDTYTPPVITSELSEAAQAVDANNDDKIDVLDFNTLMVNWGSTATGNLADFDNNNKVDIFDFNLLMIHWVNL